MLDTFNISILEECFGPYVMFYVRDRSPYIYVINVMFCVINVMVYVINVMFTLQIVHQT